MFNKVILLTIILFILSGYIAQADIINSQWVGGTQGQWHNPSSWNPAIIPGLDPEIHDYFVTIDSGTEKATIELGGGATIEQLDCYGKIEFDSGSLWCDIGMLNHGYLTIDILEFHNKFWNMKGSTFKVNHKFDGEDTFLEFRNDHKMLYLYELASDCNITWHCHNPSTNEFY